jgi:DHA1 family chloramphenicol resistance protein-like MFS transporter
VVALTAVGATLTLVAVPATEADLEPSVRRELRAMRRPQLWVVYAATLLSTAAYMISYNHLAALLTDITDIPAGWVPGILTRFGIGAFLGLSIGGRISDGRPFHALLAGAIGIAVGSFLLVVLAEHGVVVVLLVPLLGIAGFVLNPAIYGRVFTVASQAPTLAGATAVSMFQLGISLVPVLAGAALNAGTGLGAIPCVGAGLALITIPVVLLDRAISGQRS